MSGLELPGDLFPDGDRAAAIPSMPEIEPALARRLLLQAAGVVAAMVLLGYVLGQVRSVALGYLYVPAVFGAIVWLATRLMPIVNRERMLAMRAWTIRTGTTWVEDPGDADRPVHPGDDPALQELGLRPGLRGLLVVGRPWQGASADVRIADATYGSGKDANDVTMVAIALDPRVAARYPGFSLTFGSRLGDMFSNIEMWLQRWPRIDMERSDRRSDVRVRAATGQDHLAIWELFDPAFLVSLEEHAKSAKLDEVGMLVLGGTLYAWSDGQFVDHGSHSLLRTASGREQDADPRRDVSNMPQFLRLVREVHERLAAEYR